MQRVSSQADRPNEAGRDPGRAVISTWRHLRAVEATDDEDARVLVGKARASCPGTRSAARARVRNFLQTSRSGWPPRVSFERAPRRRRLDRSLRDPPPSETHSLAEKRRRDASTRRGPALGP